MCYYTVGMSDPEFVDGLKVKELQELLRLCDLPVSGKKAILQERL